MLICVCVCVFVRGEEREREREWWHRAQVGCIICISELQIASVKKPCHYLNYLNSETRGGCDGLGLQVGWGRERIVTEFWLENAWEVATL